MEGLREFRVIGSGTSVQFVLCLAKLVGQLNMNIVGIVLIAFGLAMDAFAVAVASGAAMGELRVRHALRIGVSFGAFQAIMPVAGWLSGIVVRDFIAGIDHWIAFSLLCLIGSKMIYESTKMKPGDNKNDNLSLYVLLMLSVATSIDALVVGFGFALLDVSIVAPVVIIGVTTFVLSFVGTVLGTRLGHIFENKIQIVGGLILIGIGIKILIEHLG